MCPLCLKERMLPGVSSQQEPICLDCANIPVDLHCTRCHEEDEPYRRGICARCALADDLTALLLDDGTGQVHPPLAELHHALIAQPHPRSAIIWLRNPVVSTLLADLAKCRVDLTHEAIDAYAPARATQHLRELLIQHQALPRRDRHLAAYDSWLQSALTAIVDPDQTRIVRQFAIWHHRRRLQGFQRAGTLTNSQVHNAKQEVTAAGQFLGWLSDRGQALNLCRQDDIDAWLTTGTSTRHTFRTFAVWAQRHQLMPHLELPRRTANRSPIITTSQRKKQLSDVLTTSAAPLPVRVAAALLLLYAQPVTRICRLRIDDITTGDDMFICIDDHTRLPVPRPLGVLIQELLTQRRNTNTAANSDSPWLFSGNRPGQPLHRSYLMNQLRDFGIDIRGSRNGALRQFVLDMPPALVAASLGYSPKTIENHAERSGQGWTSYPNARKYPPDR